MVEQSQIVEVLSAHGPQTGSELAEHTRAEIRELWTACKRCSALRFEVVGQRYLRLDRTVEGYARLSPSIRREFQTYTVLGLEAQAARIAERAEQLRRHLSQVNRAKSELALQAVKDAMSTIPDAEAAAILEQACFVLAGDIVYGMAHDVPRPESSTGELVRGSDLDIVIVTDDDLAPARRRALDGAIYKHKHYLLVHPGYREEIDYLIKNLTKLREQLEFRTFESMVACKIMHEGRYLYGSRRIFDRVKALLDEQGIAAALGAMEQRAAAEREQSETVLLAPHLEVADPQILTLFYTREESEEIF
jgi:hypothetical protein